MAVPIERGCYWQNFICISPITLVLGEQEMLHTSTQPPKRSVQRGNPRCGCYLVFWGPAMFDQIPCEVYLTSVTPSLLGLSEVRTDISVSHTFLHSPRNTAACNLFLALFSPAFLSLQAQIYLLPFQTFIQVALAHTDRKVPVKTSFQLHLVY